MIKFSRPDPPASFVKASQLERKEAHAFYSIPVAQRAQRRFQFKAVQGSKAAKESLLAMTSLKCAFCEQPLGVSLPGDIECYRPRWGTTDQAGTLHADLYWWLAADWHNLFPSCMECRRHRGSRFPLENEAHRAKSPGEESREDPLIIDPVHVEPAEHLLFLADGRVVPRRASRKGETTIEAFGLNRPSLVQARAARAQQLLLQLRTWEGQATPTDRPVPKSRLARLGREVRDQLGHYMSPEFPFVAVARAVAAPWAAKLPRHVREAFFPRKRLDWWFEPLFEPLWASADAPDAAARRYEARTKKSEFVGRSQWISRIEIDDFKGIEHLDLKVSEKALHSERWPWLMLLGENSAGKSSVLEAVALALGGSAYANSLDLNAADFVRRPARGSRHKKPTIGRVKLSFASGQEDVELTFRSRSSTFDSTAHEVPLMVMGYGPVRMLPRGTVAPEDDGHGRPIRVRSLFDSSVPLSNPNSWLARKRDVSITEFGRVAHSLRALLPEAGEDWLDRTRGRLTAEVGRVRVDLLELSAGYQSVLAMALDIYREFRRHFKAMEVAEGVVLIDEIGEHLHPRWKKQITKDLRAILPRVQFLVTTHDPLCLRGVTGPEVVLMRRTSRGRIYGLQDLPAVEDMRVDQILASEFFGLDGVYDESMDRLLEEYHKLLALPRWSRKQAARLKELKDEVYEREILGSTQRERMLLDAIDRYIAREKEAAEPGVRADLRSRLDQEIDKALARKD
jgi:hypothetical protein